jgi:uncharacterized caspase-like protein
MVGVSHLSAWFCVVLAALGGYFASAEPSLAEKRVALVVANAQYKDQSLALPNPRNDGADVANTLRELGFEVVLSTDVTKRQFDTSLQAFSRIATGSDSALFFYAGHAMQFQGRNYLVPVDAELEDEISVRFQTVALDDVNAALSRTSGVKVMILDACRNNPLANRINRLVLGATRSGEPVRGLARIDKSEGMVVAYATAADNVAMDGTGRNSPFTTALLNRMREPGLEIEMMFRRVTADVNAATNGQQRPETYISLLSEYYINQTDRLAWDRIRDQDDPAALRDFLRRFPNSIRTIDARRRLELLERLAEERRQEEKKAEMEKLAAAEREAARRREEAERQKAALAAQEAERTRRLAEERRQEEKKAEMEKLAAAEREATLRHEEAERQKAALAGQEPHPQPPPITADQPYQVATVTPPLDTPGAIAGTGHAQPSDPITETQLELARLGCFTGEVTGKLDLATKAALQNYMKNSRQLRSIVEPDAAFVAHLRLHERRVCPLQCVPGTVARDDMCIAVPAKSPKTTKPSVPARRTAASVRRVREAAPVAAAAPSVTRSPAATSSNRPLTGVGF